MSGRMRMVLLPRMLLLLLAVLETAARRFIARHILLAGLGVACCC